ncbi:flavin reductase family protein (plasmid) [Agrobacterium fabrum]|nr:flavin reductase family protein [Agrobacterium fabrum]
MRRLTTTVSVITSSTDGDWYGMTATAVTSVCAEPAALLVCINASSSLHSPVLASGQFCVNMLQVNQQDISTAFAGRLKGRDRFLAGDWRISEEGLPYLTDAQASLFCTLQQTVPFGTHSIVIGTVNRVLFSETISPLLYEDGKYARSMALA